MLEALLAATDFTRDAQEILRDPSNFNWSTVTLLALVTYVYAVEVEKRNWSAILAGVALWLVDWINEVVNALVLHFTDRAAVWTATGDTSYQILIGLNIEISFMFLIAGVVFVKFLPPDPAQKLLGVPNRVTNVIGFSIFSVAVEELLRAAGHFHWEYWWWNWYSPPLIVLLGYVTFYAMAAWVYDMKDRSRQLKVVGTLAAVDVALIVAFGPIAGWI
ncbi:MAG: hypothetical protein WDZ37_02130 [Solirubrobacterales bacterium]